MELAAVVVVPTNNDFAVIHDVEPQSTTLSEMARPLYSSLLPIVGNDVLKTWTARVRMLGVQSLWLTYCAHDNIDPGAALVGLARHGVERFLLIKLKSYAEMDLADLIRFHSQSRNAMTEVHDSHGQLGVCVLDDRALYAPDAKRDSRELQKEHRRTPYAFRGYAKRILSAPGRQELIGDALTGACAMRPLGREISSQVWVGEGVHIADSAKVIGPTYIGDRTAIHAGATIGPFASVERDCVVDCGATVERSTILPATYLAPGVLVRNAIADGSYLEDLASGTVADLRPAGLAAGIRKHDSGTKAVSEAQKTAKGGEHLTSDSSEWRRVEL